MKPVLYTFRRCPYAIRARLALAVSGVAVEMREVSLRDKPREMLALSPKGTVPVLVLPDGRVLDESLDIMTWALCENDPDAWLDAQGVPPAAAAELIARNDGHFKHHLDRYKYAVRFPADEPGRARDEAAGFVAELATRLDLHPWLGGARAGFADAAILPFVRQFAHVDRAWFDASVPANAVAWLDRFVQSSLFATVMLKH